MVRVSSSRFPQATTARCMTSAGRRRLPAGRAALLDRRGRGETVLTSIPKKEKKSSLLVLIFKHVAGREEEVQKALIHPE